MNKNFALLLSGQFVSQVGDKFHILAIAFWVLETTGSSAQMGIVLAASLLPSLIVGLISGAYIDRYDRKRIIVGTDLLRGLIIGCFAVLFYLDFVNLYIIIAMQVLLSINAAFFDPAIPAIIPTIVSKENITRANSQQQFVNGFSTIGGAFLGGIFVAGFGYLPVFVLNAVSFICSAFFEMFIDIPAARKASKTEPGIFQEMKQGYFYIFSNRNFVVLLFLVMVIHFFVGSIEVLMPTIASLISNDGARTLGFFQAAFGLGTIAMAMVWSAKLTIRNEKAMLFTAVFLIGVLYAVASFFDIEYPRSLVLFEIVLFLIGACIITAYIAFRSLLQKSIDNKYAGRVFAVAGSVGNASIPAAMIIFGLLLDYFSHTRLLMFSGLVLLPLSVVSSLIYKGENQ